LLPKANLLRRRGDGVLVHVKSVLCICTIFLLPAAAQNYIRVDSQIDGRSYTIDTNQSSIQHALHLVTASNPAAKMPAWLYPQAGAQAYDAKFDPISGIATGIFYCGGTVEEVAGYYMQVMRSRGMRTSQTPGIKNVGLYLSGNSEPVAVSISVTPRNGSIEVRVTHTPLHKPKTRVFEAVWYDDPSGILRLRDTASGEEYELEKHAIVRANLNRAGGVKSQGPGKPSWLPVYPGAQPPKGKVTWMDDPTAQYITDAPVRKVFEYYVDAVQAAGAQVKQKSLVTSNKHDSGHVVALLGDDLVEINIATVWHIFTGLGSDTSEHTGIGIIYKVPLH
jgi:hypothetical protein